MPGPRLSRRERQVVAASAAVAIVALVFAYALVPFYRNWTDREAQVSASAGQLTRLASLIARQDTLSQTVSALQQRSGRNRQLLAARSSSLASSELQRVMRMFAERSWISIDRMEFSSVDESAVGTTMIPFTISAVGDIYGITDFLAILRSESPVVEVTEMNLVANTALKAGLIQFSATLRAPVVIQ